MHMQNIEAGAPASRIRKAARADAPRLLDMITALAAHHGDDFAPCGIAIWPKSLCTNGQNTAQRRSFESARSRAHGEKDHDNG